MVEPQPGTYLRRSQLYRWHIEHGARFVERDGACHVGVYDNAEDEAGQIAALALCDLSLCARVGFKGRGASAWLGARLGALPERPNFAQLGKTGGVVARLSGEEYLLQDDLHDPGGGVAALIAAYAQAQPDNTWLLPRADSHAAFALTGFDAAPMLAKLCGVDLRPQHFASGAVAQTSLARVNVIVVRSDIRVTPGYLILCDVSHALYLWACFLDAMTEFDGRPVGISALADLLSISRPRDSP